MHHWSFYIITISIFVYPKYFLIGIVISSLLLKNAFLNFKIYGYLLVFCSWFDFWLASMVVRISTVSDFRPLKFVESCFMAQHKVNFCKCSVGPQKNSYSVVISSNSLSMIIETSLLFMLFKSSILLLILAFYILDTNPLLDI